MQTSLITGLFCGESCHDKSLVCKTVLFFVENCMSIVCVPDRYCFDMCLQKIKVSMRTSSQRRLLSCLTNITWALVKHQFFINYNKPELSHLFFSNPLFFWQLYGTHMILIICFSKTMFCANMLKRSKSGTRSFQFETLCLCFTFRLFFYNRNRDSVHGLHA